MTAFLVKMVEHVVRCGVRREAKCQPKKARYRWFTGVLLMVKTKMEINNTNAMTKPKTTWKMNSEIQ